MNKIMINKQTLIGCTVLLMLTGPTHAQNNGIDAILQQIAANNKELKAQNHLISSQKLENKVENNLSDPTLSYSHVWDSTNSGETAGELIVSQSFEFPTLYGVRGSRNRLRNNALDAQSEALRQEVLLQAKELCLDIILLQRRQQMLDERQKNAEELSVLYTQRLESGDANILETNKIKLELLNVRTETRLNLNSLKSKLKELLALNDNQPLTAGRPLPGDPLPTPQALGLTDYPTVPLPASIAPLMDELLSSDPALLSLQGESDAARKQIVASRQGWLPRLELGYRRNTESGHPLNGVVVGFSFPLFENRSKVKIAKAQATGIDFQRENEWTKRRASLWQAYEEARNLQTSIDEYSTTFAQQQNLSLLKQALTGGEISLIEYFVEVSVIYQSHDNLLELENQYQKAMARLYKSRL